MQAVSSYTMKPAAPMPLPMAWNPSYDSATSRSAAGTTGLVTPENTALISRPGGGPPDSSSITWRKGVPSSTSSTAALRTSPTTVATTWPGDPAVPIVRYQAAPRARMSGTLAIVSMLLTSVGLDWWTPA